MKSALSSTSLQSGLLYFVFLLLVVIAVIYLLFFKTNSIQDNLNKHAFRLNYSAFDNGIKFSNYKFIVNATNTISGSTIDQWNDGSIGLDYNKYGFPIGTNISDKNIQSPRNAMDCLQLWQFVLGPLKPEISLSEKKTNYWVRLNSAGSCEYRDKNVRELMVNYNPNEGKVKLIDKF
jgi:hypothetical protein